MSFRYDLRVFHDELDVALVERTFRMKGNYYETSVFSETRKHRDFTDCYEKKFCWLRPFSYKQSILAGDNLEGNLELWVKILIPFRKEILSLVELGYLIVIDCSGYVSGPRFQFSLHQKSLSLLKDLGIDVDFCFWCEQCAFSLPSGGDVSIANNRDLAGVEEP
ncbi:hypothetical protein [Armatimonas sp.]|uniref:hypothetical protein n=1 Tax=Armatimonas sp. TaxID=1872638 RepID=UPI003750AF72